MKINEVLTEGYKLRLERDPSMYVLHIVDTATGKRTEVRGKSGYETDGYDANDRLHQLLDRIGKTANVSELINGEVVTINPKHPDAARANAATDQAYNEETGDEMLNIFQQMHHDSGNNAEMEEFIRSHNWKLGNFTPDMFPSEDEFFDYDDPFNRVVDIDYHHRVDLSQPIIVGPKFKDGKYSVIDGNHRAARAQALGKTIKGYFPIKKVSEAFNTDVDWVLDMDNGGIQVYATKVEDAYIELTYKRMANDDVYIAFSRGGRTSVTGEGSQNKIFGAVINHIQKWVRKNKPPRIVFSAFKPNTGAFGAQDTTRSSLYRKMVQRFANQNGYDYDVEDTGNEDTFILTRKENNTQTTEALDQPYPIRWSVKNDNEWYGHAKEDDFYNQVGIEIKDGNNSGRWNIRFKVGDKMDKTGEGDQFKIFATVKAAVQEWWKWASKNVKVDVITFSAEKIVDSSRSKLYHRFAQQFARAIGYEMRVVPGRTADIFYIEKPRVEENFADGKKPGRKGLAKRSGVNTKASVSSLRKTAKNSSGEKQRMAHWLANMKAGRQKAKKK